MASDGAALLAVAVLRLAVEDARSASPRIRDSAVRFLTDPDRAADRAFWCHLAHVNDDALVATVTPLPAFKARCNAGIDRYTITGTRLDGETLHRDSD